MDASFCSSSAFSNSRSLRLVVPVGVGAVYKVAELGELEESGEDEADGEGEKGPQSLSGSTGSCAREGRGRERERVRAMSRTKNGWYRETSGLWL